MLIRFLFLLTVVVSSFPSNLFAYSEAPNLTDEGQLSDSQTEFEPLLKNEMAGDYCFTNCSGGDSCSVTCSNNKATCGCQKWGGSWVAVCHCGGSPDIE